MANSPTPYWMNLVNLSAVSLATNSLKLYLSPSNKNSTNAIKAAAISVGGAVGPFPVANIGMTSICEAGNISITNYGTFP